MALNRLHPWLLAIALQLLLISAARAQEGVPAFAPGLFEDSDFQFFSQPDLTGYGSGDRAPYGWFGSFDYLIWGISSPSQSGVGANHSRQVYINNQAPGQPNGATTYPGGAGGAGNFGTATTGTVSTYTSGGLVQDSLNNSQNLFSTETDSDTTGFLRMAFHSGGRVDFGYIDEDTDMGWLFSGFRLIATAQGTITQNAAMVLDDGSPTDTPGANVQQASVYNGIPGGPTTLPLLYGFVDNSGGGTTGNLPDGYADDVNGNNLYGPSGRDRGTIPTNGSNQTLSTGTTLSGKPINEGGADTLTTGGPGFTAAGPYPGQPTSGVNQPTDYGDAVPLPVIFSTLTLQYKDWAYGMEASRLWRLGTGHYGGTWEVLAGARYLDYGDFFGGYGVGGTLANTWWGASSENHIVGGQVGIRWRKKWQRMGLSLEARAAPSANFINTRMNGVIGTELTEVQPNPTTVFTTVQVPTTQVTPAPTTTSQLVFVTTQPNNPGTGTAATRLNQPLNLMPNGFNVTEHKVTFAPVGELRANFNYQLFSKVSLNFGWTGICVNGVGQATKEIEYSVPAFQLLGTGQHQTVILSGFNLGVTFNR